MPLLDSLSHFFSRSLHVSCIVSIFSRVFDFFSGIQIERKSRSERAGGDSKPKQHFFWKLFFIPFFFPFPFFPLLYPSCFYFKMVSIPFLQSTPSHPIYDSFAQFFHLILPNSLLPTSNSSFLKWTPGSTPLSTFPQVVIALSSYLIIIFGGRELIKKSQIGSLEKYLKTPFLIHNLLLTVGSGMLLACMLEEILPRWYK